MTPYLNVAAAMNARTPCKRCQRTGTWRQVAKAQRRQNSIIHWLECTHCGECVVAKQPLAQNSAVVDPNAARYEYRILTKLQSRFPQDDSYGTLTPVAYLRESGVLVTRRFDGYDLMRYFHRSHHVRFAECCRGAGSWLRRLHDACPDGRKPCLLSVEERLGDLKGTYGARLARSPVAQRAYARFAEAGEGLKTVAFRGAWGHGDFKPDNLLYDGHKYVGLDVWLQDRSAVHYDIAVFLDHLMLAGRSWRHRCVRKLYARAEAQFLAGYGDLGDRDRYAVRWLQIYFMLSYWARSQSRGRARALHGNWQMLPLLEEVRARLGALSA